MTGDEKTPRKLTRVERETVIVWNDQDTTGVLTTASESVIRRMKKRGFEPEYQRGDYWTFRFPKKEIRLPVRRKAATAAQTERGRELGSRRGQKPPEGGSPANPPAMESDHEDW